MIHELKLCPRGLQLYQNYCALSEKLSLGHPATVDAWNEWIIHKRGTSDRPGCEMCNGLKPKREAKNE